MPANALSSPIGFFDCPVLSIRSLNQAIYLMRLSCPAIAQSAKPGQFINVKVNQDLIPLLRKPFSVCRRDVDAGWIEILWKVVGTGTEILSHYRPGDRLDLIGPLGRGYTIPTNLQTALLVGGGLGVAPLPFLCEEVQKMEKAVEVYLGVKTSSELSMVDVIKDLDIEVFISTEDGSLGKRGLVTEILLDRLNELRSIQGVHLFSCGPNPFLRAMMAISDKRGIPGQVAIETMMGCGFGICMGCPVRVRGESRGGGLYKLTCVDGPVFDAMEIALDD